MANAVKIRKDFLDFFKAKKHDDGSLKTQVEYYLKTNSTFKKAYNAWAKTENRGLID